VALHAVKNCSGYGGLDVASALAAPDCGANFDDRDRQHREPVFRLSAD